MGHRDTRLEHERATRHGADRVDERHDLLLVALVRERLFDLDHLLWRELARVERLPGLLLRRRCHRLLLRRGDLLARRRLRVVGHFAALRMLLGHKPAKVAEAGDARKNARRRRQARGE
tara:strand:- start:149 stop:505 length:357 start_codon:yes stop_codon:yes gene_type:complete